MKEGHLVYVLRLVPLAAAAGDDDVVVRPMGQASQWAFNTSI